MTSTPASTARHLALLADPIFEVVPMNSLAAKLGLRPRRFKGETAQELIAHLRGLSKRAVVVFDDDTPTKLIETIRPDVLVKGGDYTRERVVGAGLVESWGGRVELIEVAEGRSTTRAIERIRAAAP